MTFLDNNSLLARLRAGQLFVRSKGESIEIDPEAFYQKYLKNKGHAYFIIVEPLTDENRVKSASCELSLGNECYATTDEVPRILGRKLTSNYLTIEPGEFAVLTTKEYLYVPTDLVGFISFKYSYKEKGLVNVSGFHVDPGFFGKLFFTVFNAGPRDIVLQAGKEIFLIMFAELKQTTTEPYDGKHQAQHEIKPNVVADLRGTSVSSRNLDERLKRLELLTYLLTATVVPIVITVLLAILGNAWR